MHSSFVPQALSSLGLFALFAGAGLPACRGSSGSGSGDVIACPAAPGGSTSEAGSYASGEVTGSGVRASVCNAGIELLGSPPGGKPSFVIDAASGVSTTTLSQPTNALGATLSGTFAIGAIAPGVYKSTDATSCGSLTFTYGTLVDPTGTCGAPVNYVCPSTCAISYFCADASAGQACCVPLATTYVYQATETSCAQGTGNQTPEGAWTLTLNSVAPYADASTQFGEPRYVAHGSFTATLKGTVDTTGTATLSLTF